MFTLPETLSISPRIADSSEDFPEPTGPMTAVRDPSGTFNVIFRKTTSLSQVNVPFSTVTAVPIETNATNEVDVKSHCPLNYFTVGTLLMCDSRSVYFLRIQKPIETLNTDDSLHKKKFKIVYEGKTFTLNE